MDDRPDTPGAEPDSKRDRDARARLVEALPRLRAALATLGAQGLQRMSAASVAELQALQQTAHFAGLVTVARHLDALATHLQRYLDRDPLFHPAVWLGTVNRVWLTLEAVARRLEDGQSLDEMSALLGEARRSFTQRPDTMALQCVGASGWVSDTDYVGVTVLLVAEGEGDRVYEVVSARPTMYFGRDPRDLVHQPLHETVSWTLQDLLHGAYSFERAKVSDDGRLSLHKDLVVREAPYRGMRAWAPFAAADAHAVVERLRTRSRDPLGHAPSVYALLKPARWGALVVDDKRARCHAELVDARGAVVTLEVPLREENNPLVDNLEHLLGPRGRSLRPQGVFGRATVHEGRLVLHPMTVLYDRAVVLGRGRRRRVHEVHLSVEDLSALRAGDA